MPFSNTNGTATLTLNTEQTLTTLLGPGVYQLAVDVSQMAVGDELEMRVYSKTAPGIAQTASTLINVPTDISNAAWATSNATVILPGITGPDGNADAELLQETTANGFHDVSQPVSKAASAITYSVGIVMKGKNRNALIQVGPNASPGTAAVFDMTNGVIDVGSTPYGTGWGAAGTAQIVSLGNGFYDCQIVGFTTDATNTSLPIFARTANGTIINSQSYTGDGVSGVYVTNVRVVQGTSLPAAPLASAASNEQIMYMHALAGVQDNGLKTTQPVISANSYRATLKQTAGTARPYKWAIYQL